MTLERLRRCSRGQTLMVRDPRAGGTCVARFERLDLGAAVCAVVSLMRRDGRGFSASPVRLTPGEVRG
jgi:hypothetical protein